MIIFTVTNTVTNQIYVGATRNDLDDQWEKMVAAAEQNLDYPLYRDIRTHGEDAFTREIYDMAETRTELAELERDALETLGAISLKGHKTSTVLIRKKKPVRRRKNEAEKELLALLDGFASDADDELLPEAASDSTSSTEQKPAKPEQGRVIKAAAATNAPATAAQPVASKPAASKTSTRDIPRIDPVAAAKAILAAAAKEEEEKKAASQAPAFDPKRASRTSSNVKLELSIDDTINAQLAAITAAVDGVLSGDVDAATQLETLSRPEPALPSSPEPTVQKQAQPACASEPESESQEPEPVTQQPEAPKASEKELRIIAAMERHRQQRASRTSDIINAEKARIQELLGELNSRVAAMPVQASYL